MGSDTEALRVVLLENAQRFKTKGSTKRSSKDFFAEEYRRMNDYDTRVCPFEWQGAISAVKMSGFDPIEIARGSAQRQYNFSMDQLEKMVHAHNLILDSNKDLGEKQKMSLSSPGMTKSTFSSFFSSQERYEQLRDQGKYPDDEYPSSRKRCVNFKLEDKIKGLSFLFARGEKRNNTVEYPNFEIYGVLKNFGQNEKPNFFLNLGSIKTSDLKSVATRRFNYIFGYPAPTSNQIAKVLSQLNKFPQSSGGYGVGYSLVEKPLGELSVPKSAPELFDEVLSAKKKNLFSDVKVYILNSSRYELPSNDPVIVGTDPFGHQHPFIYWSGDKEPVKELKRK